MSNKETIICNVIIDSSDFDARESVGNGELDVDWRSAKPGINEEQEKNNESSSASSLR